MIYDRLATMAEFLTTNEQEFLAGISTLVEDGDELEERTQIRMLNIYERYYD